MARRREKAPGLSELGHGARLWKMADALRNNMDAVESKHVARGLILLKNILDAFETKHAELEAQTKQGADARWLVSLRLAS